MRHYLDVFQASGVARLLFSQLIARFPAGMLAIALLIHMEQRFGAYAPAGAVVAVFGVGVAIAGPLGGRLLSRIGMRRTLTISGLVCAGALVAIALIDLPVPATLPLAFIVGITTPPIQSATRTLFPHLVGGPRLATLFTVDATLQEIIWILGPLVTTTIAAVWSTRVGILAAAGLLVIGSVWFISSPILAAVKIPPPRQRFGAVLRNPVLLVMSAVALTGIGAWGAADAATVAQYGHDNPVTGLLLGVAALGSFMGGMLTGQLPMRKRSLTTRALLSVIGVAICVLFIDNPWLLGAGMLVAGASSAPLIAVINAGVSASMRKSQTTEAFGWLATAMNLGGSLASALAGVAIDFAGAQAGMTVAAALFVAAFLIALATIRVQPDLSQADISPRTDTISIPIVPS